MEPAQRERLTRCSGDTATLLGWLKFYAGQPSVASGHLEDARQLARETGDMTLHAQALGSLSILHGFPGVFSGWDTMAMDGFEGVGYVLLKRPYEAEAALRRGLALAEGARRRATALADLGAALALQNEPEMSTEVLHESLTLALEAGNAMGVERIRGVRAAFPEPWALLPCVRELDDRLRKAALSSS